MRAASLAALCSAALALSLPVSAQRWGRVRTGATFGNVFGGVTHVRGGEAFGPRGVAGRRSYTATAADGSVVHQGGRYAYGAHGGSYHAGNRYDRNPDGSAVASRASYGRTANGGVYGSEGSYARSADGSVSGSRQAGASGPRGDYYASSSTAGGVTTRNTTVTAANGHSYHGQTTYTRGQGVTHSGGCADAGGNPVACGH